MKPDTGFNTGAYMTKGKQRYLLILYVLATALIFSYLLFPSTAVKEYLAGQVTKVNPSYYLNITTLTPSLPPGLLLTDVQLFQQNGLVFNADSLKMSPKWLSLFSSKRGLKFRGKAYQGELSGVLSSVKTEKGKYPSVNAEFSELNLMGFPWLQEQTEFDVSGALSGKMRYEQKSITDRSGSIRADIANCIVTLSNPLFDVGPLEFNDIKVVAMLKGNTIDIQQGTFAGNQIDGSMSGTIRIQTPVENSRLQVNIKVKPERAFLSNLSGILSSLLPAGVQDGSDDLKLRVTGTLGSPKAVLQ